jgi:hypothetical protein
MKPYDEGIRPGGICAKNRRTSRKKKGRTHFVFHPFMITSLKRIFVNTSKKKQRATPFMGVRPSVLHKT